MLTGIVLFLLIVLPYAVWRHKRNTRVARELLQQRYDEGLIDPGVVSQLREQNPKLLGELEMGRYRR